MWTQGVAHLDVGRGVIHDEDDLLAARPPAVGGVVVDHQHRQSVQRGGVAQHRALSALPRDLERRVEPEGAALAHLAPDLQPPTQHLGQPGGDGQPQPCATIAPCGGPVGLNEGREDGLLLLPGNADPGVLDREADLSRPTALLQLDHHLPALGELDRVAHEVDLFPRD